MSEMMELLGNSPNFIVAMFGFCVLIAMTLRALTTVITTASRERSRREIAAYIAEGSLTPEQGERLIKADVNGDQAAS